MLLSLHHVTATVDQAQPDLDFAAGQLGLRLVKKTVNFDNNRVYHFYYGNESGSPGTIWTTFPYAGMGVPVGVQGAGQITATSFSVPARAVEEWSRRLADHGLDAVRLDSAFGEPVLALRDPSGLAINLVGVDRDARRPWVGGGIAREEAVRGLHAVTLTIRDPGPSVRFLEEVLGASVIKATKDTTRLGIGGAGPGQVVDIVAAGDQPQARNGLGTVHHVAFAIAGDDRQLELRERLMAAGVQVTPVRDRCYFHSIYFREPGGVLYEVATVAPGFDFDEPLSELGSGLKLPPWEEGNRREIEAGLPRVVVPGAG